MLRPASTIRLNNGSEIPVIGLGTYKTEDGDEVQRAVEWALEAGYRMIDTAAVYGNEKGVGHAIKSSGIPREELFVTTKLANRDQGYDLALSAIDVSLARLGLDTVDLYLVHWPSASEDRSETINKRAETWRAMEKLYNSGKAKAIGVSNYCVWHLEEMKGYAHIPPMVNQVEFHPFLYQKELLDYCTNNRIILEAYSPLVKARKMENGVLGRIAEKYGKSIAQVLIRWSLQKGCVVIPKSVRKERITENISVFDFELADEDMEAIDTLHSNDRQAWDPTAIS